MMPISQTRRRIIAGFLALLLAAVTSSCDSLSTSQADQGSAARTSLAPATGTQSSNANFQTGSDTPQSPDSGPSISESSDSNPYVDQLDEYWLDVLGPIDAILYDGSDPVRLETAIRMSERAQTSDCMQAKGWQYTVLTDDPDQVRRDMVVGSLGTVLADDAFRNEYGYGITKSLLEGDTEAEGQNANATYYISLSFEEQNKYDDDQRECVAASATLSGPDWDALSSMRTEALQDVASDPAILSAMREWSSCMLDHGFVFNSVTAAPQSIEERARPLYESHAVGSSDALALHQDELELAGIDWECQRTTFLPIYKQIRDERERRIVDENIELVFGLQEALRQAAGQ